MRDSENSSPFTAAVQWNAEPEKRNSGRTGPTSAEGRAASSKNAIKHGACAETLILPGESEEAWELLLNRWLKEYQPAEDSLEYDFVLKTAQAEWQRIRSQRNFNDFLCVLTHGSSPYNWSPEQIKKHDLSLRYKTAAERAFQRECRLLEQYYKIHRPKPAKESAAKESAAPDPEPRATLTVVGEDPDSPTGLTLLLQNIGGVETKFHTPYYPPGSSCSDPPAGPDTPHGGATVK
jgi:hypothetical protein